MANPWNMSVNYWPTPYGSIPQVQETFPPGAIMVPTAPANSSWYAVHNLHTLTGLTLMNRGDLGQVMLQPDQLRKIEEVSAIIRDLPRAPNSQMAYPPMVFLHNNNNNRPQ